MAEAPPAGRPQPRRDEGPGRPTPATVGADAGQRAEREEPSAEGVAAGAEILPTELRRWNWGAFLFGLAWLAPVWGLANGALIGLTQLLFWVPGVPAPLKFLIYFGVALVLGLKGSEWAWRARHWESVERFKQVQRNWQLWGVSVAIIALIIYSIVNSPGAEVAG